MEQENRQLTTQPASVPTTLPKSSAALPDRFERATLTPAALTPAAINAATVGITNAYESTKIGFDAKKLREQIDDIDYHLCMEIPEDYKNQLQARRQELAVIQSKQRFMPTIEYIDKHFGRTAAESVIKLQLISLNMSSNTARPLNEGNIEEMAPLIVKHIIESGVSFNMADIRILFDRAKTGAFGKFYGGLGAQDVCGWIDAYITEKLSALERLHGENRDNDRSARYDRLAHQAREIAANRAAWAQYLTEKAKQS